MIATCCWISLPARRMPSTKQPTMRMSCIAARRMIAEHALFKKDEDVVPIAGTVATVFAIDSNGVVKEKDANLLGENYWGISNVLSR